MNIKKARELIHEAEAILITAGAGMGVDSGLPDFRGKQGFWKAYPPIEKLGLSFQEMANAKWFKSDPKLAWAFYGHRLNLYRDTIPHDGFRMLLDLVKEKNDNYFIYTSNVDGQFQKAGFNEEKIHEIHGSIHYFQCTQHREHPIWKAKHEIVKIDMETFQSENLPLCPLCNALARPNILMFGDWDWKSNRSDRQKAKYRQWIKAQQDKKIVIIEVGAGVAIPSIRRQGEYLADTYPNTILIRINPRDYTVDKSYGISVPLNGAEGIKAILQE